MTEIKNELLPCPFCGSKNVNDVDPETLEEAVRAWNSRSDTYKVIAKFKEIKG